MFFFLDREVSQATIIIFGFLIKEETFSFETLNAFFKGRCSTFICYRFLKEEEEEEEEEEKAE